MIITKTVEECQHFFYYSDLFRLKFEEKWVHMYELAKVSLINKANEIKSIERRSSDQKEQVGAQGTTNSDAVVRETYGSQQINESYNEDAQY